jgi:hypothetical protein
MLTGIFNIAVSSILNFSFYNSLIFVTNVFKKLIHLQIILSFYSKTKP